MQSWGKGGIWILALVLTSVQGTFAIPAPVEIPRETSVFFSQWNTDGTVEINISLWNHQAKTFEISTRGELPIGSALLAAAKTFSGFRSAAMIDRDRTLWFARWSENPSEQARIVRVSNHTQRAVQISETFSNSLLVLWRNGDITYIHYNGAQDTLLTGVELVKLGITSPLRWIQQIDTDVFTGISDLGVHRLTRSQVHGTLEWNVESTPLEKYTILDMPTQSYTSIQTITDAVIGKNVAYVIGYLKNTPPKFHVYALDLLKPAILGEEALPIAQNSQLIGIRETDDLVWKTDTELKRSTIQMGLRAMNGNFLYPRELSKLGIQQIPHFGPLADHLIWNWPTQMEGMMPKYLRPAYVPMTSSKPSSPAQPQPVAAPPKLPTFEELLEKDLTLLPKVLRMPDLIRFVSGYTPEQDLRSLGPVRELFGMMTEMELFRLGLYRAGKTHESVDGKERAVIDRSVLFGVLEKALARKLTASECSTALISQPK